MSKTMGCLVSSLNNDLKESSSGPAVTPPIRLNNSKLSENGKQSSIEDSATEACSDSQDKRAQISSPSVQSLNEAKISHCPEPARQSRKTSSYLEFPPGLLPKLKQPKHEASIPSILSQENLKTQNTEEQEREIQSEKLFNDHCKAQDRIRQEAMNQASLDNSGLLKGEIQDRGLELQETAYEECQEEERQSRSPSLQNISDPGRNLNRGSGITNEVEQASKPVSQTKRKLSRVNPNLAESIAEACGLEISNVQKKINEVNCEMEEKEMILESFPHLNGEEEVPKEVRQELREAEKALLELESASSVSFLDSKKEYEARKAEFIKKIEAALVKYTEVYSNTSVIVDDDAPSNLNL